MLKYSTPVDADVDASLEEEDSVTTSEHPTNTKTASELRSAMLPIFMRVPFARSRVFILASEDTWPRPFDQYRHMKLPSISGDEKTQTPHVPHAAAWQRSHRESVKTE